MKYALTTIFSFFILVSYSQDTLQGCLFLDFENIDDLDLFEGFEISDQFEDEFGLTFSLEGGGFPVLAEIGGSPAAAYGSAWGNDTPDPQDAALVGNFFLTDDGVLAGLESPPIILDFANPIDSFAGCIMDMDFDEVFKIEAFDDIGALILEDSIMSGDPGTGDGRATCWGFNLEGCTGTVSQIKFSGFREQDGFFGLGLDNFSFCYAGVAGTESFVICESDSVVVNGDVFYDPGIYEQELISSEGCDSLVYIDVEVLPEYSFGESYEICPGESVIVNGISYSSEGIYQQNMQTAAGCDSTLNINISEFDSYEIFSMYSLCEGDTLILEDTEITEAGVLEFLYQTVDGCDSLVILDIDAFETYFSSDSYSFCEGGSVIVNGTTYNEAGLYEQEFQSVNGCDSLVSLTIVELENASGSLIFEICPGDSILVNNEYFSEAGSYSQLFSATNGCDSLLSLTIVQLENTSSNVSFEICEGDSILVNNEYFSQLGSYSQVFQAQNGCDSTLLIDILVNPIYEVSEEHTICSNEEITINGVTYNLEGSYVQNLNTVDNCDSTLTININVLPTSEEYIMFTIIEGDVLTVNDIDYNLEGVYDQLLVANNGCDSLLIIDILVLPPNPETFLEFPISNCYSDNDLSEFAPTYPVALECSEVQASSLDAFSHSCTPGIDDTGALCISSAASCTYDPDSPNVIGFNFRVTPDAGNAVVLSTLSFYEKAPESFLWSNGQSGPNNYPTKYGLRILKDNVEVYSSASNATEQEWNLEEFDFTGIADFRIEESALYRIEFTPYCTIENGYTVRAWDLDQIMLSGYCTQVLTRVKGKVSNAVNNSALSEVDLWLNDGENIETLESDSEGYYAFDALDSSTDYTLSAYDNKDPLLGVSTIDLVLLQKHILGIKPFEEDYLYIAGDINKSGTITAIDLVELRKLILGIHTEFPHNTSWRFFDSDENYISPWIRSEEVDLNDGDLRDVNWEGIKIGDLNESSVLRTSQASTRSQESVFLTTVSRESDGQTITDCVATEPLVIDGMQLAFNLKDSKKVKVYPGVLTINQSDYHSTTDQLKIAFAKHELTIEEGQILFSISTSIENLTQNFTIENAFYTADDLEIRTIKVKDPEATKTEKMTFNHLSSSPNPFVNNTTISFNHPRDEEGSIKVIDHLGRQVSFKRIDIHLGLNEVILESADFSKRVGSFHVILQSASGVATHKVVHIE